MATHTELRVIHLQELNGREAGLLGICRSYPRVRARQVPVRGDQMGRMTIGATNVVAPVFAAAKVVVLFLAGVTGKAGLRSFFR